jgi:hypothetical protein
VGIKHCFGFRDSKDRKGTTYTQGCRTFRKIKGLGGGGEEASYLPIDSTYLHFAPETTSCRHLSKMTSVFSYYGEKSE